MLRGTATLAMLCLALTGCAQSTYNIQSQELRRLAQVPAVVRGQSVRVTQDIFERTAPRPTPLLPPAPGPVTVDINGVTEAAVVAAETTHRSHPTSGRRHIEPQNRSSGPRHHHSGTSDSDNVSGNIALGLVVAVAALAASVTVALALTEGARYDGWVRLQPQHPVHLLRERAHYVVPLYALTPEQASWATEGYVSSYEGVLERLRRAPLDRVGFVYQFDLGTGGLYRSQDTRPWGFLTTISLGGFPIHQLGLLAKVSLGLGSRDDSLMLSGRYGVEVQGFFVYARRFHLGLYAEVGSGNELSDVASTRGLVYGGGALVQVELLTRLALVVRGGVTVASRDAQVVLPVIQLGLAVY